MAVAAIAPTFPLYFRVLCVLKKYLFCKCPSFTVEISFNVEYFITKKKNFFFHCCLWFRFYLHSMKTHAHINRWLAIWLALFWSNLEFLFVFFFSFVFEKFCLVCFSPSIISHQYFHFICGTLLSITFYLWFYVHMQLVIFLLCEISSVALILLFFRWKSRFFSFITPSINIKYKKKMILFLIWWWN